MFVALGLIYLMGMLPGFGLRNLALMPRISAYLLQLNSDTYQPNVTEPCPRSKGAEKKR
jgi:hypothetical protein